MATAMKTLPVTALPELLVESGLSPASAACYAGAVRRFDAWAGLHGSSAAQASAALIVAFQVEHPAARETAKLLKQGLRHYWTLIGRRNPPLAAIRVPRKPRYRCRALPEDAASRLERAAAARGDRPGAAVLLGLYLALRRTEISRLRHSDFADPISGLDVGWVRIIGKGGIEADLPVVPLVLDVVRRIPVHETGWLFPGRYGGPVTGTTIWNWVRRVAADADLVVTTHQLRHTALATANDATHDLRSVQDFARHARPETTALYTRTTTKALVSVAMAIDYQRDVS